MDPWGTPYLMNFKLDEDPLQNTYWYTCTYLRCSSRARLMQFPEHQGSQIFSIRVRGWNCRTLSPKNRLARAYISSLSTYRTLRCSVSLPQISLVAYPNIMAWLSIRCNCVLFQWWELSFASPFMCTWVFGFLIWADVLFAYFLRVMFSQWLVGVETNVRRCIEKTLSTNIWHKCTRNETS